MAAPIAFEPPSIQKAWQAFLEHIPVALVTPVFVNRIFVTEKGFGEAFANSFKVVYRSENGLSLVGLEVLMSIFVGLLALLTCGPGALW